MARRQRLDTHDVHALGAGAVAALVGFTSSFAIILAGLRAVGATEGQAASGLFALCIVMGSVGVLCSVRLRMPLSVAWSTPGAALLVTAGREHFNFRSAVGAFILAGVMAMGAGVLRPLWRVVAAMPPAIGSAMLAGILLPLCEAPVIAAVRLPRLAIPVVLTWIVLDRLLPRLAVAGAIAATVLAVALSEPLGAVLGRSALPSLHWTTPTFGVAAFVSIAVPLFIVTMAAQNLPGLAVLAAFGYEPELRPILLATGGASVVAAPFGGHAVNLAAITAALCAAPEVHPDPKRRWLAGVGNGSAFIGFGLLAGIAAIVATLAPTLLLECAAGLALLRALGSALAVVGAATDGREAAVIAFIVTASQISIAGIGSPFWGLVAGGVFTFLARRRGNLDGKPVRRSGDEAPDGTVTSAQS